MDTNTVLIIVVFAIIIVAVVLVYRRRTSISVKGPAGMGLDVNASNDPAAPTPGAVLERAKGGGSAKVEDQTGRGARGSDLDIQGDIQVMNRPAPKDSHPKA